MQTAHRAGMLGGAQITMICRPHSTQSNSRTSGASTDIGLPLKPRDHFAHENYNVLTIGTIRHIITTSFGIAERKDHEYKPYLAVFTVVITVKKLVQSPNDRRHFIVVLGFN